MRIRTFGGLWIEDGPSRALGPRRMALLALVAAGTRRGTSRDRVLGLLWPDAEEEQARHALSQTLYSLRRDTGRDWITATPDLRLDPALTSDVGELRDALAAGDADAACALHTGEFLEGFYLPDAPEFERWVEEERGRLRGEVARAAERGVIQAEREGDHAAAVRLWTRLTELDPLNARYAAGRMRALVSAGDRASALAHARRHEDVVRRELEAEVDPAVRSLADELKAERGAPATASQPPQPSQPRHLPLQSAAEASSPPGTEPPSRRAADRPSRRAVPQRRLLVPLVGIAVLLAAGVFVLRPGRPDPAPFLAVGTIRILEQGDTSSLGPVLRDMLSTSLGGLRGLRVVANSRLVELTPPESANERGAITDAARRAGATEVIEGELATEAGRLVLALRRVDLGRGEVRKGYVVRAGDRYALVDSAAATIARDLGVAQSSQSIGDLRTTSPEAYLLYNEGLRAYYGFDAPGGYRLMNAALERDSTFVMAAYYAWIFGENIGDVPTRRRELERVKRLAPHTIERERLLLQAEVAGREAPIAVAAAIAETLTVRYPAEPDGHLALGKVRQGQGEYAAAIASFHRALRLDSTAGNTRGPYCRMCLALGMMVNTYIGWDSAAAAEREARRIIALQPDDPNHWVGVVEPLLRQGRRAEAVAALERSQELIPVFERFALHRDLIRWGRHEELDRALGPDLVSASNAIRGNARWFLLLSLRDRGRLREARALALESRIPGSGERVQGHGPEMVLSATMLQGLGRPDSAARLLHAEARGVLADTGRLPGTRARDATWRLTLAATAYAQAGDTATVRRLADSIEVLGLESTFGRDPRLHRYLRGLLLQAGGRHAEAVAAFRRAVISLTDGYSEINLAMARSLLVLGRPAEAVEVLRPAIRGGVDGSNTYTSRTELHEAMARAFELAGQRDSAVAHHRVVEGSWRNADPEFTERYARARALAQQAGGRLPPPAPLSPLPPPLHQHLALELARPPGAGGVLQSHLPDVHHRRAVRRERPQERVGRVALPAPEAPGGQ